MLRLDNKVAVVTGGASGIGRAIAIRLASEGARVVTTDVQIDLGRKVASEEGFEFLEQDVSDESQWTEIIQKVEQQFGKLNILVNNAGILGGVNNNPENTSLADWRRVLSVNLDGVFLGCRAAIPAMRTAGGGAIVNVSSITSEMATSNIAPYGASKAAVRQFTKSVAEYCARQKLNIRCNSVHPGFVLTPLQRKSFGEIAENAGLQTEQVMAGAVARIPLGDFTREEDIAAAVAFLASDDARHVTGAKLLVDGGVIMD